MKKSKVMIPLLGTVIVALTICIIVFIKINMPSKERMSLDKYFDAKQGSISVIMQDSIYENKGLYQDGHIYLDIDLIKKYINKRFYWDNNENLLLYATPDNLISAEIDSNDYRVNKSKASQDYKIVTLSEDKAYVALEFVKEYSAVDYVKYDKPDRVVITYRYNEKEKMVKSADDTQLRYKPDIKSPVLSDVKKDDELHMLEQENKETGFCKAMTKDGIIGYVKGKKLGEIYDFTPVTDFKEEKYSHILMDEKVNLVWHQVTNRAANGNLTSLLSGTKGVNVVSPTWFKTSDNNGNIDSIADYSYVEKAHKAGLQVWGLCDDFSPEMKIGKVLGTTSRRQRLEKNLIAEAIRYSLDGINIDFENVKRDSGEDFIQFIRELSIMCRNNGIVLSIDDTPPASYSEYYNRTEQAEVADYVIIMAYDEYYPGSEEAGPVSSLSYVQNAVENTLKQVPKEQTIIGLPFYSRLWTEKTKDGNVTLSSEAYSMPFLEEVLKDNKADITWDEERGLDYAEYNKGNAVCKAWIENKKSLEKKLDAVAKGDTAGVAFWKLGMEKESVWNTVAKNMSGNK